MITGFYTVRPDQRAALTTFGRAQRLGENVVDDPDLTDDERERYRYPAIRVISPGGPDFKWPWQQIYKISVATQALDLVWDPTKQQSTIEAVTKDNLTTGVNGQIRFRTSENNLYAYLFGVQSPLEHVMGYFISVLRERIANFVDPKGQNLVAQVNSESGTQGSAVELSEGVSINDLRKNLHVLNVKLKSLPSSAKSLAPLTRPASASQSNTSVPGLCSFPSSASASASAQLSASIISATRW